MTFYVLLSCVSTCTAFASRKAYFSEPGSTKEFLLRACAGTKNDSEFKAQKSLPQRIGNRNDKLSID